MSSSFKSILCPVELDEYSFAALDTARALADLAPDHDDTVIWLLHLLPIQVSMGDPLSTYASSDYRAAQARRALAQAAARHLKYISHRAIVGYASHAARAEAVIETAAQVAADLIVMATHGRSGLAHLIRGSVAEEVARRAPCPVLTVGPNVLA
ncbi:MAG: universal stress protein, partial [Candidatus Binataceae bacterium]